jgi:streptogramin lyase
MITKSKQRKHRPALEGLEDRTLLSYVPLDQVLLEGIGKAGTIPPLSLLNLYSPLTSHNLAPAGQIPPGAVPVGLNGETGETIYAVADKYIAEIQISGLSAAAAADPKQLLGHADGELVEAKAAHPSDSALGSITIDKYLGAGRYLVSAGTNLNNDSVSAELTQLPGFQSSIEDYLFPSNELNTNAKKATPTPPPPTVPGLSEIGAAGGQVYSGTVGQTIIPGSTISFSVNLDAGQSLAAVVTPSSTLQVTLQILDPKGKVIASATGSAQGALTAIQAISIGKSGTYQVAVSGANGSGGSFTLQDLVDAQLQNQRYFGGPNDSTQANAQQIDNLTLSLNGNIIQSAVYGNIPIQPAVGDEFVSERGVGVQLVSSSGVIEATFNNPALSAGTVNGMHIGPNGNLYVGVDTSPGNGTGGEIVEMTQTGSVVTIINLPNDPNQGGFFFYPFGFAVASDSTLWVAQPNTGNVVHLSATGSLIKSYAVGGNPEWDTVRSDGQVFISNDSGGKIQQLDPGTGNVTTFATDPSGLPFGLSFTSGGDLIVADPNVGIERFNSSGTLTQTIFDFNAPIDTEADPSGNIVAATFFNFVDRFTAGGALIVSTSIPGNGIGVGVLGSEGQPPPTPQTMDFYKISLSGGQAVTAVLSELGNASANLALVDSSGHTLALGKVDSAHVQSINSFIASAKGTYYLEVIGNGVQYSLVVVKNSDFSNGTNISIATAQNLFPSGNGGDSAVGALTSTALWGVDWQNAANQLIHTINTQTGAFTSTFSSPSTTLTNPFGFNMAFDGTNLWFNDGAFFGSNTIFKLNPANGALLGSFAGPATLLTGLAYLNGSLWGVDLNFNIYQINPTTGAVTGQFSLSGDNAVTGIAGDPDHGVLWAVSQNHTIYEIDPVKQMIIKSAPDGLGLFEQDIGYFKNELYISETNGPGFNDIAVLSTSTLTETRDLPMNVATFISGLAADGIGLASGNFYHFSANAKAKLFVSTSAPFPGPFQPANSLNAVLQLWDANGNLLATSAPGAGLGWTAKYSGDYYVSISGANGTVGDYTLTVQGVNGPLPAFTVTGTNPPANSYNKPFKSITVDFNDTIYLPSLAGAKVTFGGLAATGFQVDNDHEVTWFLQAVPPGQNVPYTFAIAAGTMSDIHGVALTGFSETIIVNTIPPHLITNSISEGSVLPDGSLTYTCSFQEAIVPSSVGAGSFDLHGMFRNADYSPDSFSFDATDTILTVNFSGLPQDNYTLTLIATGFMDRAGFILDGEPGPPPTLVPSGNGVEGGNFFVHFTLRHAATEALPVNFSSVPPIGDQIYQGSFTDTVVNPPNTPNDYTVNLAPNQTLTLDLMSDANLQGMVQVFDPSHNLVAAATASGQGNEVVLQTAPITGAGIYTIAVSGANGTEGLFSVEATLNAAATTGMPSTMGTAQDLTGSFLSLGGTSARGAVLGSINQLVANTGDAYVSERGGPGIAVVANAGGVESTLSNPVFATGVVQGMHEGPDGHLYVGLDTSPGNGTGGEILNFSPSGTLLGTIHLPNDTPANFFYYPFGFSIASDGTFWVGQPNSGHVVHLTSTGGLIKSYSTGSGSVPEWTAVRGDGQVFISNDQNGTILQLDPTSGNVTTFTSDPAGLPFGLTFDATTGDLLVSDPNVGVLVYDMNANLLNVVFDFGALDSQLDPSGNFMIGNADFNSVDKLDQFSNFLASTGIPGTPIGLSVAGVDGPAPPPAALDNFYSFQLNAGQATTIVYNQLGGTGTATVTLEDSMGNVLATAVTGPTNFSQVISNFVAASGGTYYIDVHGNNINYGLTVTKDATFDSEPNNSQVAAQPLPAAGGAVGAVFTPPGVTVGTTFEGMSFFDTSCGCIPPDTNDAVGPTQVVEAINLTIRISEKNGTTDLTQDLSSYFGINAFSDPYIVYDDIANRFAFVVLTLNSGGGDGLAFAVSKDSNPLDGWLPTQVIDFGSNLLDFPKIGFNADAYVITGNLFGPANTPLQVITVDKSQLFMGNFVDYLYQRNPGAPDHFRAEVPAQMHGATPGMPMYLVEEAGYGNGSAARIVTLTNELSNSPVFTDTDIPVDPYGFPAPAGQPGAPFSAATNDTTFSHADWRMINGEGMLVSAQNVGLASDGFSTSKVRWYEFNTSGTPSLVQQGTIDPGSGVSTYYGAPALDVNGDIGITYMESSANEFVSMYVAGRQVTDPLGTMSPGTDVAPGQFTDFNFFRTGDYGGMSVDPTDGKTFWASHEYAGTNPVYNTFIASFTVQHSADEDWYSFSATAGQNFTITLSLPGSSSGAQFVNVLSPVIQLYDPNGNLVASGTTSISYTVPAGPGGTYAVRIQGANNTQGEYFLLVQDPPVHHAKPLAQTKVATGSAQHAGTTVVHTAMPNLVSPVELAFVQATSVVSAFSVGQTVRESAQASNLVGSTQSAGHAADAVFAVLNQGLNVNRHQNLVEALSRHVVAAPGVVKNENADFWTAPSFVL